MGYRAHALHAFSLATQLVVVDHLVQPGNPRFEGGAAVLVKEEFGIRKTRPDDTFVATDHGARIFGCDVAHHQEPVGQPPRRIQQGKVLLVGLHGEDQAFLWHGQELGVEFAHQHIGPLDQGGHFVQQRGVRYDLHAAPDTDAGQGNLSLDLGAPL